MKPNLQVLHLAQGMSPDERAISEALESKGWLKSTVTHWTSGGFPILEKISKIGQHIQLKRPSPNISSEHLLRVPAADILPMAMGYLGASGVQVWDMRSSWLGRRATHLLNSQTSCVIGRAHGSLELFKEAKKIDVFKILHHPHPHHQTVQRLLDIEEEMYPGVCRSSFDHHFFTSRRIERFEEEISLADAILCPSRFSAETVSNASGGNTSIKVIPYGCPCHPKISSKRQSKTFLIAGNLTARKGVHRVLRVWKELKAYRTHSLKLIGDMHLSQLFLKDYQGLYEHVPKLPRIELFTEYSKAAALILNALAEGMANVIGEAMGCGTPVLVSRNSGADGFISDNIHGRLFPFGDDAALAETLEWALTHSDELSEMGASSLQLAQSWSWQAFQNTLTDWMNELALFPRHESN